MGVIMHNTFCTDFTSGRGFLDAWQVAVQTADPVELPLVRKLDAIDFDDDCIKEDSPIVYAVCWDIMANSQGFRHMPILQEKQNHSGVFQD